MLVSGCHDYRKAIDVCNVLWCQGANICLCVVVMEID